MRDKTKNEASNRALQDRLRELRQFEVQLRREDEERRSLSSSQISSQSSVVPPLSTTSSSSTARLVATPEAAPGRLASATTAFSSTVRAVAPPPATAVTIGPSLERPVARRAYAAVATPHGGVELQLGGDEEDTDMFYGMPSRRPPPTARLGLVTKRATPGSIGPAAAAVKPGGAAAAKPGGGKWGALFGASSAPRPAPAAKSKPAITRSPVERPSSNMKSLFANRRL